MRKLLKSLACFATAALVGASAFANYDWYDTSIGIGGIKSNFQDWSRGNGAPDTDLGALTSLTLSSVEMNIWDDDNDRGGVNMFFRLYGDNGQIGGDVDVWLGGAERIEGSVHDFSVSYTGPYDLADAFGVTLEDGKTYYLNMWAKSYGDAGDHWYSGDGDNYHTKFVYCGTPKTYTLVESADDLVVGADYLVVSTVDGAYSAMKNEVNGSGIGCLGLADDAISGNTISAASDAIVWQIVSGTALGQRELYNAAANVFAADSDDLAGRAQLLADGTDALAQWTIDTSALPDVKFYSVSYPDRCLQRDNFAANERFAAYDRAHVAPCLYRDDSTEIQTVTFDPNGGTYPADKQTMKYVVGREYWGIHKPTWAGHKFLGWYDAFGKRVVNFTVVTEESSRELTARWGGAEQTVTLEANGGSGTPATLTCSGTYKGLVKPVLAGYQFLGWYDAQTGGTRIMNGMVVSDAADLTLYARWGRIGQSVTLEANGGSCTPTSLTCSGTYKGIPKPAWDGHLFKGWYDAQTGGTRIMNGMVVSEDAEITLYARWRESAAPVAISGFSMSFRSARGKRSTTTVQDVLTADSLGLGGSYADFSGKTATSKAVYAGQAMKGSGAIQMRSKNSNSGIVTTGSGGKVAKVAIDWSSGKKVDIYGKNTAYSAATDLYDSSTQGTLIGSITNSSELAITDEYTFIGLRSNDGAVYLNSVTIDWLVEGDDPPPSTDPTVTLSATAEEVYAGEAVTITASAANFSVGEDDLAWEWSVNGIVDDIQDGKTFTLDTSVANTYEVKAEATDGDAITNATVSILVKPQTVTLTPSATEVEVGETVTITATAEGFSGAVTWTWAADLGSQDGATYTLTPSAAGEYVVMAEATYGTQSAEASVTITVSEHVEVTGDVLTNDDVGSTSSNYGTWTATKASGAEYAGQSAGGSSTNPCIQLRSNNNNSGIVMTKGSGRDVSSVTIEWNAQSGADRVVDVYGSATAYSSPSDLYGNAAGTFLGSVTNGADEVTVDVAGAGAFPFVGIRSHSGALYLTSVTIEFASATPKVTLAASATEVEVGQTVTITATATGFSGDVTWEWLADAGSGSGDTYTLTPSVPGEYEVIAEATCGDESADASVTITATAVTTKYAITIDPAIEHGSISTDPAGPVAEGTPVTVNGNPDAGYVLGAVKVNGTEIEGTTFNMPAADVTVSATFVAVPTYTLVESEEDFVVGADYLIVAVSNSYASALKNVANGTRIALDEVVIDGKTIATASGAIVWQIKSGTATGQRVLFNAAANVYAAAPNSEGNNAQLLADGTNDLAQWTLDFTELPEVKISNVAYTNRCLQRNSSAGTLYFATYTGTQKSPRLYRADSTVVQTVTFDANGGEYPADKQTMKFVVGREYWGIHKPTWAGHKFLGWYDANGNRVLNYTTVTEESSRELTARWGGADQVVTLEANGGSCTPTTLTCSGTYKGLVKATLEGYQFLGWYDAQTGGTRIQNGMLVSEAAELTLYARWGRVGQAVTLNANGGSCTPTTLTCSGTYKGLVKPTWDGHQFKGWYDAQTGGTRFQNGMAVTEAAELTLFARWKELVISSFSMKKPSGVAARGTREATEVLVLTFDADAGLVYDILWTASLDGEWTVLKSVTADQDGAMDVSVDVPADSSTGFFRLRVTEVE